MDGPIEQRRRELVEQQLREDAEIARRIMLSLVPKKFQEKRLYEFQPRNPSQKAALEATSTWVSNTAAGKPGMLALIGPTGTGKSMLFYGAAWDLFENHKITPAIVRWYLFAKELKYGRGPRDERGQPQEPSWEVSKQWYAARPGMIDEIRPTSGTEADATELALYAMNAYDEEIPVMVTTNIATLSDVMGTAAADRFTQVTLVGESYRGS